MSRDPLIDAIVASPEDDEPRLVWADREGGERGELVVIQCTLEKRDPKTGRRVLSDRAERLRLVAREREILAKHLGKEDEEELAPEDRWWSHHETATWLKYARGFATSAVGRVQNVATAHGRVDRLFEDAPLLRTLRLAGAAQSENEETAAAHAQWSLENLSQVLADLKPSHPLRALVFDPAIELTAEETADEYGLASLYTYIEGLLSTLSQSPRLRELLTSFEVSRSFIPSTSIKDVLTLQNLESLNATFASLESEDPCEVHLRILHGLPKLRHFLFWEPFHAAELRTFLESPELKAAQLQTVRLGGGALDSGDLEMIANAPSLAHVSDLEIRKPEYQQIEPFEHLAASPHLKENLRALHIPYANDELIEILTRASFAPHLEKLNIGWSHLTVPAAIPLLLNNFPSLEVLNVVQCRLDRKELQALRSVIPEVISIQWA